MPKTSKPSVFANPSNPSKASSLTKPSNPPIRQSSILVTGGTGYIGSHTVVALIEAGYNPVIVDNLINSKAQVLKRVAGITGKKPPFYKIDLRDTAALDKVFRKHKIDSVIHFAGLKAVGESVAEPLRYYENNILGSISLFFAMEKNNVKKIIFSSSASVYGEASAVPIKEDAPVAPANPYASSKLIIENILKDVYVNNPSWQIVLLRYFNPVGAHQSGLIGEDPQGIPNNLMPYISQVAVGRRKQINVFGKNYPTKDGTGVRDYIHVMDLADGHLSALRKIEKTKAVKAKQKPLIINLGTGRGYTVLEVIEAFAKASGRKIPYKITKRRPGDIAVCYAGTALAKKLLGWKAKRNLARMCADAWRWQSQNPEGY
jgi:UDP-glucose 4-epimerase